jgi:hypothetical protein
MATHLKRHAPEPPLSEGDAEATFERLKTITAGLLQVPKGELEQKLAEKRTAVHKRNAHSDAES